MNQKKNKNSMNSQFSKKMEENKYLIEQAKEYFNSESELEEWFCSACFIKKLVPNIPDEILMPNILPFYMVDNNLIKFEEIDEYFPSKIPIEAINQMKREFLENSPEF